jgi:hypothetical protein
VCHAHASAPDCLRAYVVFIYVDDDGWEFICPPHHLRPLLVSALKLGCIPVGIIYLTDLGEIIKATAQSILPPEYHAGDIAILAPSAMEAAVEEVRDSWRDVLLERGVELINGGYIQ